MLNIYCDDKSDSLLLYTGDYNICVESSAMNNAENRFLILTAKMQAAKNTVFFLNNYIHLIIFRF